MWHSNEGPLRRALFYVSALAFAVNAFVVNALSPQSASSPQRASTSPPSDAVAGAVGSADGAGASAGAVSSADVATEAWARNFTRMPLIGFLAFLASALTSAVGVAIATIAGIDEALANSWFDGFLDWVAVCILVVFSVAMSIHGAILEYKIRKAFPEWVEPIFSAGDVISITVATILVASASVDSLQFRSLALGVGVVVFIVLWWGFRGIHAYVKGRIYIAGTYPSWVARSLLSLSRPSVLVAVIVALDTVSSSGITGEPGGGNRPTDFAVFICLVAVASLYSFWETRKGAMVQKVP